MSDVADVKRQLVTIQQMIAQALENLDLIEIKAAEPEHKENDKYLKDFLKLTDIAKYTGLSYSRIYSLSKTADFPAFIITSDYDAQKRSIVVAKKEFLSWWHARNRYN